MDDNNENEVLFDIIEKNIALITLNRPSVRNAINENMTNLIEKFVRITEESQDIRAVILGSSNDRAFCSGADLKEMAAGRSAMLITPTGGFAGLVDVRHRKPWIAAIRGAALGGGCELMLACDMIVAGAGSRFGLPEVQRGLIAAAGGVHRLPRALPRHIALEMVATGEPMNAERAYALGLVNYVVPPEDVLNKAVELARRIAGNGPIAVARSMELARMANERDDSEMREISHLYAAVVKDHPDSREGALAFLEKRNPQWTS